VVITSKLRDRKGSVNICDSTRLMRRILGVVIHVISETAYRRFKNFSRELPSLYPLFCWALMAGTLLFSVSGCTSYKEELDSAKQQIEKLNSDVKRLTEETARLKQEESRLRDDSKTVSNKDAQMQRELDDLSKARAALSAENKEIRKKHSVAEEQITALRLEKDQLAQEVEELKKRVTEFASPPTPPAAAMPTEVGPKSGEPLEDLSPCDAVLAFMKASEGIVRQHKGTERTALLEQVKQQYAPRMKGAPEKAIKAAENWVKEGVQLWDESDADGVFQLLQLRNIVLDACGKSPNGPGFK
jgi:outer membrane murein-binding lipoprotein Lpp